MEVVDVGCSVDVVDSVGRLVLMFEAVEEILWVM